MPVYSIYIVLLLIHCSHLPILVNGQTSLSKETKKVPSVMIEGSGSPVVMIPGGSFSISVFDKHAQAISADHMVIRIDHLNVIAANTGTVLPENYSVRTESEAVGKKLDSLKVKEPAVIVGHSLGALIALDFALNHPERIRSLILVEPPAFWIAREKGEHPPGMDEMISVTSGFGPNVTITDSQLEKFVCALGNCPDGKTARDSPQWATWKKRAPYLRGLSAVGELKDSVERLQKFIKPVLIVTGTETVAFHRRINELLAAELPNESMFTLPGGHGACVTNAIHEFIDAIRNFTGL